MTTNKETENKGQSQTKEAGEAPGQREQQPGAGDGAGGQEQPKGGVPGSEGVYRPEGLPEHLLGGSDKETIDKLQEAYKGARDKIAKNKAVPEKIEDYVLDLPKELAEKVLKPGEDGKDPVFESMRGLLFKHGIGAEAAVELASALYGEVGKLVDAGGQATEELADWGYKDLGGVDKAKPKVAAAEVWIGGLQKSGKISEGAAKELQLLTTHGGGLKALDEIRALLGDKVIPANFDGQDKTKSLAEQVEERRADERYWKDSGKFDQGFYDETIKLAQKLQASG